MRPMRGGVDSVARPCYDDTNRTRGRGRQCAICSKACNWTVTSASFPGGARARGLKRCCASGAVPVEVRETERLLLRSRMLGAPLLCDVGLGFRDGTLSEVGIAARTGPEEAERAFSTLQARLESLLGQRGKAPLAQQFGGPSHSWREYTWEMPSLRVRHILDGRFALTESISIRFGSPSAEDGGNGKQPRRGALAANGWNVALAMGAGAALLLALLHALGK